MQDDSFDAHKMLQLFSNFCNMFWLSELNQVCGSLTFDCSGCKGWGGRGQKGKGMGEGGGRGEGDKLKGR